MSEKVMISRELLSTLIMGRHQDHEARAEAVKLLQSQPVSAQPAGEVPDVLLTALRQYRHNYGDNELIAGYDYDETNRIVAALQARAVVMPERLKIYNDQHYDTVLFNNGWNAYADEYARLNGKGGV